MDITTSGIARKVAPLTTPDPAAKVMAFHDRLVSILCIRPLFAGYDADASTSAVASPDGRQVIVTIGKTHDRTAICIAYQAKR